MSTQDIDAAASSALAILREIMGDADDSPSTRIAHGFSCCCPFCSMDVMLGDLDDETNTHKQTHYDDCPWVAGRTLLGLPVGE